MKGLADWGPGRRSRRDVGDDSTAKGRWGTACHPGKNSFGLHAFTAYLAICDYNFGPRSVRNIGVNNPAGYVDPEEASLNGPGNAYPILGTGQTLYVQSGLLLPLFARRDRPIQLQPFVDYQSSDFDGLDGRMNAWTAGVHWLIRGMNSRLSLAYQSRPIFQENEVRREVTERKGMIVLQYQFRLN